MGLIKCVDCGHMVSDRAKACPQCGCPIGIIKRESNSIKRPEESNTVVHPKFGRGKIIDSDGLYMSIVFESTNEKKRFVKSAVMPMLKFMNENDKQRISRKDREEKEAVENAKKEERLKEFWSTFPNWKNTHLDYEYYFLEYSGNRKEKNIKIDDCVFTFEDTPVGAVLTWIKQESQLEQIYIPNTLCNSPVTFIAESVARSDLCYEENYCHDLGLYNTIFIPKTVCYIENIHTFFSEGIQLKADEGTFIYGEIEDAKVSPPRNFLDYSSNGYDKDYDPCF